MPAFLFDVEILGWTYEAISDNTGRWPQRNSDASCACACRPQFAGGSISLRQLPSSGSSFDRSNIRRLARPVNEMGIHILRGRARGLLHRQVPANGIISR
jgi:hypothetical protein